MSTVRGHSGVGVSVDGVLCACRSCYAWSVGLAPSAVTGWRGQRKCRHNNKENQR